MPRCDTLNFHCVNAHYDPNVYSRKYTIDMSAPWGEGTVKLSFIVPKDWASKRPRRDIPGKSVHQLRDRVIVKLDLGLATYERILPNGNTFRGNMKLTNLRLQVPLVYDPLSSGLDLMTLYATQVCSAYPDDPEPVGHISWLEVDDCIRYPAGMVYL